MDKNLDLIAIGQRIRAIRTSKGMSQAELGFAAHLATSNISDIELGKTKMWLSTFVRIVEALQVSADSILRPDVPEVNGLYQKEYAQLLADCTPAEIEAIMKISKESTSLLILVLIPLFIRAILKIISRK